MPGLPHFTNSKAATKYYEPFYQNLFEVSILPPPTIAGGEILLEHVISLTSSEILIAACDELITLPVKVMLLLNLMW